MNLSES
jgi:hypothetical protein